MLFIPPPAEPAPKSTPAWWIIVGAMVAVLVLILIGYALSQTSPKQVAETASTNNPVVIKPETQMTEVQRIDTLTPKTLLMSAEEKVSRENVLKALLEVQSATALGVTHNKYGELLIKADSTLNFEKTKLSTFRHERFLSCAENAMRYYGKANDEWSDYFKYDWMREKNETFMYQYDFNDLQKTGVKVNPANYPRDPDSTAFCVPFDLCLSLYWKAAYIYIEKMKDDASQ